jgi:transposase-like protein
MAHGGRPTKYKKQYCSRVIELFSEGKSIVQIAAELDVSRDTIYQWQKEHPEFSDTIKKGMAKSEAYWEHLLQGGAAGLVTINSAALIFLLKNRFHWKDRSEQEISGGLQLIRVNDKEAEGLD